MQGLKKFALNTGLLAVSLVASLWVADRIFLMWERSANKPAFASGDDVIDFTKLNYNETLVPRQKQEGEYRILSFGDSFAYTITRYPYSYPAVAAQLLNEAGSARRVRIVNLGQPSISFHQYISGYRYWAPQIEHDAVVFNLYLGNDILDIVYQWVPHDAKPDGVYGVLDYNVQTGKRRIPEKFPLRMLDYAYAIYLTWKTKVVNPRNPPTGPYSLAVLQLPEDDYFNHLTNHLENYDPGALGKLSSGYEVLLEFAQLASEIRQSGTPVLILLSPEETQVDRALQEELARRNGIELSDYDMELPVREIRRLVASVDAGLPVLSLLPSFVCGYREGQDLYYRTDTHWSVEGNRLAGENLAYFIANQWLGDAVRLPRDTVQDCVDGTLANPVISG